MDPQQLAKVARTAERLTKLGEQRTQKQTAHNADMQTLRAEIVDLVTPLVEDGLVTIVDAAKWVGVTRQTLDHWMKQQST